MPCESTKRALLTRALAYYEISSEVTGKAGGLVYVEWGVLLNEIGGNASSLKLLFYTYDRTYSQVEVALR